MYPQESVMLTALDIAQGRVAKMKAEAAKDSAEHFVDEHGRLRYLYSTPKAEGATAFANDITRTLHVSTVNEGKEEKVKADELDRDLAEVLTEDEVKWAKASYVQSLDAPIFGISFMISVASVSEAEADSGQFPNMPCVALPGGYGSSRIDDRSFFHHGIKIDTSADKRGVYAVCSTKKQMLPLLLTTNPDLKDSEEYLRKYNTSLDMSLKYVNVRGIDGKIHRGFEPQYMQITGECAHLWADFLNEGDMAARKELEMETKDSAYAETRVALDAGPITRFFASAARNLWVQGALMVTGIAAIVVGALYLLPIIAGGALALLGMGLYFRRRNKLTAVTVRSDQQSLEPSTAEPSLSSSYGKHPELLRQAADAGHALGEEISDNVATAANAGMYAGAEKQPLKQEQQQAQPGASASDENTPSP